MWSGVKWSQVRRKDEDARIDSETRDHLQQPPCPAPPCGTGPLMPPPFFGFPPSEEGEENKRDRVMVRSWSHSLAPAVSCRLWKERPY